ncbi:hypothetical protein MCBRY_002744 [Methylocystis bryophila]
MRVGAFEIVKRGVARYDLTDPYHLAVGLSSKEFAFVFLVLGFGINAVFALLYLASPGCIAHVRPGSFSDAFFFSIETLATVGYGTMVPATFYGHAVSAIEILCGMVFAAIMTGLLFVRFSKPRSKICFADRAVITTRRGAPTLMVQVANGRTTLLTSAVARLVAVLPEENAEEMPLRQLHDLVLSNGALSLFSMTWTVMHEIDENSPLAGYDPDRLRGDDVRLVLSIEARDHLIGAVVHDLRIYGPDDILHGMHYAETVTLDDRLRPVADLTRLSLVEPDSPPQL